MSVVIGTRAAPERKTIPQRHGQRIGSRAARPARSSGSMLVAMDRARDAGDSLGREPYSFSDDPARLDVDAIHAYLARSYWAEGIPRELVERSIHASVCYGAFRGREQVGFCRAVTDGATFAYLCDVYVLEEHRGRGIARRMLEKLHAHPRLQGLRRWLLVTRDAHGLYERLGWRPLAHPQRMLEIARPGLYAGGAHGR
jgi:GNAT superfamily N-acetyltransferase